MAFKKGNPGGPGRPKGATLSDEIRKVLEEKHKPTGKTYKRLVAEKLIKMALEGDSRAASLVLERSDGKVPDVHKVGGGETGEGPIEFTISLGSGDAAAGDGE